MAADSATRAMIAWSPSPILHGLFKLPTLLYRLRLGWLLEHRFMQLTHRGRISGRVYRTVLEVVHYDPNTRETVVCSGWGTRADWYRNIIAHQPIKLETGGKRFEAPSFRVLGPKENYSIISDYVRRLPAIARPLAYRLGLDVRGSEDERRAHSERLLMVVFGPRKSSRGASELAELVPSTRACDQRIGLGG